MGIGNWLVKQVSKYLTDKKPKKPSYLCDFDRICHEVRPADVLLVEGKNRISRIIQRITHSPWTHAVLFIGRPHDIEDAQIRELVHKHYKGKLNDQLIIESIIGKGTIITHITEYENNHVRICRPSGLSFHDAQKVIHHSVKTLGKEYNIRHFFDLGRFLLGSRFLPRRWRSSLFLHSAGKATQDICSSMIAQAFTSIKFPILPLVRKGKTQELEIIHRNPKLFTPSDFDYSPYFEIIKYPIFLVSNVVPYRNLPWNEELISDDEIGVFEKEHKPSSTDHQSQSTDNPDSISASNDDNKEK